MGNLLILFLLLKPTEFCLYNYSEQQNMNRLFSNVQMK